VITEHIGLIPGARYPGCRRYCALLAVVIQLAQNAAMIKPDPDGYLVTGSDTDVGKT